MFSVSSEASRLSWNYKRIFQHLVLGTEGNITVGIKMFQWILHSRRGLTITELQHAFAIPDDPNVEFIPTITSFESRQIWDMQKRVIHCGRNFLEIRDGGKLDYAIMFPVTFFQLLIT